MRKKTEKTEWRNIDWLGYYEQLKSLIEVDPVYGTQIKKSCLTSRRP